MAIGPTVAAGSSGMMGGSPAISDVTFDELKAGLSDGSIALVDVREAHEFEAGAIPGSLSMPLSGFDPAALPANGRIVFSCAAGVRSRRAIELSRAAGRDLGEHFAPGFKGWVEAGEPVA